MESNFTHMWGILESVRLVNSKHTYFFLPNVPPPENPTKTIHFLCILLHEQHKLKVSQQRVSSQFSLDSIFSDLVLQLVNFEPLGGAKTDPRGKKKPDHPQAEIGMCYT